ncbi:DUF1707 domain-containing protein [Streptomyces sp. NPDC059009]|uniref:DUF1707 SHOCT-like domain-containing protein n=1 Tax=Streptomyces sp. NPDC059009 TaxID=3346694 RepID=UPI0036B6CDC5
MDLDKRPQQDTAEPPVGLRASDADRDRVADILREALAEGRLTAEEHAERIDGVYRAKTQGELTPLIRDLPGAHQATRRPAPAYEPAPVRPAEGSMPPVADENVVAVLSAASRRGHWRVSRRTHAYAIFGNVELDLSEAIFEHRQVVIKAVALFGSIEVRVPQNVSLRGNGGGVLGTFEVDTLDSAERDAPVVYVDGLALFGSVEAKPRRGKLIRDLHAKLRKHLGS